MDERTPRFVASRVRACFRTGPGALGHSPYLEVFRTPQFTAFDHDARCAVVAFHFPPVRQGVLLPHLYEVLGEKFVEFLAEI